MRSLTRSRRRSAISRIVALRVVGTEAVIAAPESS